MDARDGIGEEGRDGDDLEFSAGRMFMGGKWDGVGDDEFFDGRGFYTLQGRAREDRVGAAGEDAARAARHEGVRAGDNATAGVNHIVHHDARFIFHVADNLHDLDHV